MTNIFEMVKYNADGLIPAVTQDIRTDEVLMLAYMNEESLRKTIETGRAYYYSRSRQKLWLKGETSGHFQKVRSISIDCDGDTLLLKVEQTGAACHTGHHSCFFTRMDANELASPNVIGEAASQDNIEPLQRDDVQSIGASQQCGSAQCKEELIQHTAATPLEPVSANAQETENIAGAEVLQEVFDVISDRLAHPKEGSYTNYLFTKGLDKILKKIGEESCEVVIASKNGSSTEIKSEIADLFYHVMVLLAERGMTLLDVYGELKQRE